MELFFNTCLNYRLYDLSVLCAEVASHIRGLNSEWLGVLKALCCTSMHGLGFDDLQETLDVSNMIMKVTFLFKFIRRTMFSKC